MREAPTPLGEVPIMASAYAFAAFGNGTEAPAAQRLGVPSLPRAVVAAGHSSTPGGIPRGRSPLASLCLLSAGQK